MTNLPGYGDSATWPSCSGHPLDPRFPPDPPESQMIEIDIPWITEKQTIILHAILDETEDMELLIREVTISGTDLELYGTIGLPEYVEKAIYEKANKEHEPTY